jgi:hypothetical protein
MNGNPRAPEKMAAVRSGARVYSLSEITISYEGQNAQIVVKPPNLSTRGMFIDTSSTFPEGAVLNLRFTLALTGAEVRTRCEVRYSQPGVGIGVEFIGLPAAATKIIEREISMSARWPTLRKSRKRLKKRRTSIRS